DQTSHPSPEVVIVLLLPHIYQLQRHLHAKISRYAISRNPVLMLARSVQKQLVDVEMRSKPTAWAILGSFDYLANQGHCQAERRTNFGETWETVAQKVRANGLKVILCILKEREEGRTTQVVEAQLRAVVKVTKESDWRWMKLDS
ncbi:hypothetical protein F5887DRAFT_1006267, partial [Amanita rubescens]